MLKNKILKLLLVIFSVVTLITPLSYAENEVTTTESDTETSSDVSIESDTSTEESTDYTDDEAIIDEQETDSENQESQQEIFEGDLYIAEDEVLMTQLVNGNVYIIGNKVKITGQIAGNLFVLANEIEFDDAYIQSSAYLCGNSVYFKAVASDLYVCCKNLEIPNNYGVYRDIKSISNSLTLLGIVGRNADCGAQNITLEKISQAISVSSDETSEDAIKATIYGDFNYSCPIEIEIPEGSVEGNVNRSDLKINTGKKSIASYITSAVSAIVFTLVIYGLASLFAKSSIEKCTNIVKNKFIKAYGIGIISLIAFPIVSILLMISVVGIPVAFALIMAYILMFVLATSVFSISITNIICEKFNLKNKWLKILFVSLISLIVYIIGILPYVWVIKSVLVFILGFGTLIMNIFFKNINFEKTSK